MSFQFRFATILQLRRRERDEAGAAVGQANAAIGRIDEQSKAIQRERQSLRERASEQRVGSVSVDALLTKGRYEIQLEAEIQSLAETRAELIKELERRQDALVASEAEVKRFERLQEKERAACHVLELRREQAEADDATARRYTIERRRKS
jgi:flagellar FliJ protein